MDKIQEWYARSAESRATYIEIMAAAYLQKTGLEPTEAVLIEEHYGAAITWRFVSRTEYESVEFQRKLSLGHEQYNGY